MVDTQAYGMVFNVGSSEEISINQLAEKVVSAAGSASQITYVPYDDAYELGFEDMDRRIPDTTRVREMFGWEPTYTVDEIISDVITYGSQGDAQATLAVESSDGDGRHA